MNKNLEQLIELNRIDRSLAELEPVEKKIKAPLLKLEQKREELEEQRRELEHQIKELKLKRSKSELALQEFKDKLDAISAKMNQVQEEREYKALAVEEEFTRDQINQTNEEIARFEKLIEQRTEELKSIEQEIEKIEADITLLEVQIKEKLELLEKQRQELFRKKEELISQMNPSIYGFYEKIKRWAGITAVTPVERKACTGCNMVISDKIYYEIVKGDDIITCPHCGRVLFVPQEGEEEGVDGSEG
jgi:predicted  nucleic acid-binding Zn-ribbon protein